MATEKVTFDADVSGFLRGLARVQAGQKELKRDMQATAMAAANGSKAASAAYVSQSKALAGLRDEHAKLSTSLTHAIHGTQSLGKSSNRTGAIIGQLSFAVDDFSQVVGTSGLAGGLRAAGNNLSMVGATIHPLLGAFTGVTLAAAAFALQTSKTKEKADEAKEALKKSTDSMNDHQKAIDAIGEAYQKTTMSAEEYAKHEEAMPARLELVRLDKEGKDANEELRKAEFARNVMVQESNGAMVMDKDGNIQIRPTGNQLDDARLKKKADDAQAPVIAARKKIREIGVREKRVIALDQERAAAREQQTADAKMRDRAQEEVTGPAIDRAESEMKAERDSIGFGGQARIEARARKAKEALDAARQAAEDSPQKRQTAQEKEAIRSAEKDVNYLQGILDELKRIREAGEAVDKLGRPMPVGRSGQEAA